MTTCRPTSDALLSETCASRRVTTAPRCFRARARLRERRGLHVGSCRRGGRRPQRLWRRPHLPPALACLRVAPHRLAPLQQAGGGLDSAKPPGQCRDVPRYGGDRLREEVVRARESPGADVEPILEVAQSVFHAGLQGFDGVVSCGAAGVERLRSRPELSAGLLHLLWGRVTSGLPCHEVLAQTGDLLAGPHDGLVGLPHLPLELRQLCREAVGLLAPARSPSRDLRA
mmetsp:Transcript_21126/g.59075  ORF Transcript_21126/g.59075 Transcript_21126/m.59075 type:complete len:228 (+) Transcript_21126:58-741(+)